MHLDAPLAQSLNHSASWRNPSFARKECKSEKPELYIIDASFPVFGFYLALKFWSCSDLKFACSECANPVLSVCHPPSPILFGEIVAGLGCQRHLLRRAPEPGPLPVSVTLLDQSFSTTVCRPSRNALCDLEDPHHFILLPTPLQPWCSSRKWSIMR